MHSQFGIVYWYSSSKTFIMINKGIRLRGLKFLLENALFWSFYTKNNSKLMIIDPKDS